MSELLLMLNDSNGAELFRDGAQVWASDSDPDLLEELGTDKIEPDDIGDVLEYLVDSNYMTQDEALECPVDSPDDDDDDDDDDEDEDEDEDYDEIEEGEDELA